MIGLGAYLATKLDEEFSDLADWLKAEIKRGNRRAVLYGVLSIIEVVLFLLAGVLVAVYSAVWIFPLVGLLWLLSSLTSPSLFRRITGSNVTIRYRTAAIASLDMIFSTFFGYICSIIALAIM